jgi:hypothetical protein
MYNRLFTKILDSSVWLEPIATRIVWVTLIAAMDEDGVAHFSALENLSLRARVSLLEAEQAVECFLSPDKNSGDPENDGRRLERIPGGYLILNAAKYRAIFSREIQRERTRIRVANHRKNKKSPPTAVTPCNVSKQTVTQSEAGTEACTGTVQRTTRGRFAPPSIQEVDLHCAKIGLPASEGERFVAYYESNGWKVGKNPMKSWTAALINWRSHWQERNHGTSTNGKNTHPNLVTRVKDARDFATITPKTDVREALERRSQRQKAETQSRLALQTPGHEPAPPPA